MYKPFAAFLLIFSILQTTQFSSSRAYDILPFIIIKRVDHLLVEPLSVKREGYNDRMIFSANFLSKELYFCPLETDQQKIDIDKTNEILMKREIRPEQYVSKHCLFEKEFSKKQIPRCSEEPTPVMQKLMVDESEQTQVVCGEENVGKVYTFRYELCFHQNWVNRFTHYISWKSNKSELEPLEVKDYGLYNFCFDQNKNETLYTEHMMLAPRFIEETLLKQEQQTRFEMQVNGYPSLEESFRIIESAYTESENPQSQTGEVSSSENQQKVLKLKTNTSYIGKELVSPDDMVFALWRKPTFHFVNIKPMHEELVPLWDYISELVRLHAKKHSQYGHKITTGAFQITDEEHRKEWGFIEGAQAIPEIWVKIVQIEAENVGIAIVMSNYFESVAEYYCPTDKCEFSQKNDFPKELAELSLFVRCCSISEKLESLFGTKWTTRELLLIENLNA